MKVRLTGLIAVCLVSAWAIVTIAQAGTRVQVPRSVGDARPHGRYEMQGVITDAINVRGERTGERVRRTWMIHPTGCSKSACRRLQVVRNRGSIQHSYVVLHRIGPGRYQGRGVFWVGLRCLGRTYRLGSRAPYVITLAVTGRRRIGSIWYATALQATYTNSSRSDGTRCPLGLASDAARYSGRLTSALPKPPRRHRRRPTRTSTTPTPTVTTGTITTPPPVTTTGTNTTPTPTTTTTTETDTTPPPAPGAKL